MLTLWSHFVGSSSLENQSRLLTRKCTFRSDPADVKINMIFLLCYKEYVSETDACCVCVCADDVAVLADIKSFWSGSTSSRPWPWLPLGVTVRPSVCWSLSVSLRLSVVWSLVVGGIVVFSPVIRLRPLRNHGEKRPHHSLCLISPTWTMLLPLFVELLTQCVTASCTHVEKQAIVTFDSGSSCCRLF